MKRLMSEAPNVGGSRYTYLERCEALRRSEFDVYRIANMEFERHKRDFVEGFRGTKRIVIPAEEGTEADDWIIKLTRYGAFERLF